MTSPTSSRRMSISASLARNSLISQYSPIIERATEVPIKDNSNTNSTMQSESQRPTPPHQLYNRANISRSESIEKVRHTTSELETILMDMKALRKISNPLPSVSSTSVSSVPAPTTRPGPSHNVPIPSTAVALPSPLNIVGSRTSSFLRRSNSSLYSDNDAGNPYFSEHTLTGSSPPPPAAAATSQALQALQTPQTPQTPQQPVAPVFFSHGRTRSESQVRPVRFAEYPQPIDGSESYSTTSEEDNTVQLPFPLPSPPSLAAKRPPPSPTKNFSFPMSPSQIDNDSYRTAPSTPTKGTFLGNEPTLGDAITLIKETGLPAPPFIINKLQPDPSSSNDSYKTANSNSDMEDRKPKIPEAISRPSYSSDYGAPLKLGEASLKKPTASSAGRYHTTDATVDFQTPDEVTKPLSVPVSSAQKPNIPPLNISPAAMIASREQQSQSSRKKTSSGSSRMGHHQRTISSPLLAYIPAPPPSVSGSSIRESMLSFDNDQLQPTAQSRAYPTHDPIKEESSKSSSRYSHGHSDRTHNRHAYKHSLDSQKSERRIHQPHHRSSRRKKLAFSQESLQRLVDESPFKLDELELPKAERHLIDKFVDSLARLSTEITDDARKRPEGLRRLHNALKAIEGWI